ncbi:MAG TPA: TonB C-terminal domain-containing protein [Xanthobacteraceae bacterium]|jgi:colicin import membrane protein
MRTAYTISAIGHAAVLLWSVWSLAARPLNVPASDSLPVDIVTSSEFSQITQGVKSAPQTETPKPLVEKVAEAKPVDDPTAKVVEKKEVKAARETEPAPEVKPAEEKPKDAKQAETKVDPIAEALSKEQPKHQPKKAEAKPQPPTPPKKPAPPAPKFDPKQVEALLDKRNATRLAAAGETLNSSPGLGLPNGHAAQLSQSELDALRARLRELWNPPLGSNPEELVVVVEVRFRPDGTVEGQPRVLSSGRTPMAAAARDSAVRALLRGQPFTMLRREHYDLWKDIEIKFDPREMIRG